MKISLGPIYFYWTKEDVFDFYDKISKSPVNIVYLGEVICSKRSELKLDDWLEIAKKLKTAGIEVVLSTLTLLEAESELKRLDKICDNKDYLVEANDFAAINLLSKKQKPFVVGPSVNIYNLASIKILLDKGLRRWCLPVELSKQVLSEIITNKPSNLQTEVFAFGKLPLAFSARCFTARNYDLDKDDCQYKCLDHQDGLLLKTQENEDFLTINGIQTMSALSFNLIKEVETMQKTGVDILRISPQFASSDKIIQIFKDKIDDKITANDAAEKLTPLIPYGECDGYWQAQSGLEKSC